MSRDAALAAFPAAPFDAALPSVWQDIIDAYHARNLVVVFDMDGTAVDNEFKHRENLELIASRNGAGEMAPWPWEALAGQANATIHAWICANYPDFHLCADGYRDAFERAYVETKYDANPTIFALQQHLNARGVTCGINTSTPSHMSLYALEVAGYELDQIIFLSADMLEPMGKMKKPAPDSYQLIERQLQERMGLHDPYCVAFEDTRSGATAALATQHYRLVHLLDDPTQRLSPSELEAIGPHAAACYFPVTREDMTRGITHVIAQTASMPRPVSAPATARIPSARPAG